MSADADRLAETANVCAGHAATALATLLDATLLFEPPRVRELAPGQALAGPAVQQRPLVLGHEALRVAGVGEQVGGHHGRRP